MSLLPPLSKSRVVGIGAAALPVAALVALASAAAASGEAGSAKPINSAGSGQALTVDELSMKRQAPLIEAAAQLRRVIDEDHSGFAGLTLSPERGVVTLYWSGAVPTTVRSQAQRVAPSAVVEIRPADYSLSRLEKEARRLLAGEGPAGVVGAGPNPDGSGLSVQVTGGESAIVRTTASRTTGVPVEVEVGVQLVPASRWADTSPFWGGAVMYSPTAGCSSGFAVSDITTGTKFMMTAAHCSNTNVQWKTPAGVVIGTSVKRYPPYETMLIRATTAGRIYDGATDPTGAGSGEFSKPVIGWRAPTVGMNICQSGSYSGVRCGIKVTKTNYSYNLGGDIGIVGDGVVAEKTDRTSALGQGDSGGPSFTLAADPAKVYALGINSAIDTSTQVACTGYNYSGRQCAWRMIFANIQDALRISKTDIVKSP